MQPSTRKKFSPRELAAAYEDFIASGPQYLDAETSIEASAYRFGTRVLIAYEEPETGVTVLIHPSAWKGNSQKSTYRMLHSLPLWERRMAYFPPWSLLPSTRYGSSE